MMAPSKRDLKTLTLTAVLMIVPLTAGAAVRKEGAWPAAEKKVSFDFDGKPEEGLKKLADEAGWSLVLSNAVAKADHDVHIKVADQPADAVLEALFAEANVVARRSGSLVTVGPDTGAATPGPAVPPVPTVRGQDRNVMAHSLHIDKGEIVHTVTVTGGSATIEGTVTGDLVVAGGSAHIEDGGRVVGNVSVFGGSLSVENGGRIDGDVGIVGGSIHREEGAFIGGSVVDDAHDKSGHVKVRVHDGEASTSVEQKPAGSRISLAAHSFGQTMTKMALLFVYGCALLALATRRMESMRIEAAARPMRSFALGIVGSIAALFVATVACLTIVGIPFAVLALLLGVLAVYGSMAAVLTTVGSALLHHKTQSPYVHLLLGCAIFLVLLAIPYVGTIAAFVVTMISIGLLVSTRGAGLFDKRRPAPQLI